MLDRLEVFIFETREVRAISIGPKKSVYVTKSLIGPVKRVQIFPDLFTFVGDFKNSAGHTLAY